MKISLLCLLALALLSSNSFGQGAESRRISPQPRESKVGPRERIDSSPQDIFANTAREITLLRPAVDEETLTCDAEVVRMALPEIQRVYLDSGLTEEDAQEAALAAWKEVRLASPLQPDKCMVSSSYTTFTLSLGALVFKSNPPDANITLNGNDLAVKTAHRRLVESDIKHRVRFSRTGFESVEIECTAAERKNTDCYAELKPTP